MQQRGIKFDPARDLANLKSAVKGVRLEIDREWMENLPHSSEAENLEVTVDSVFTHPEILVIPTVTTESEVTPPHKYDRAQERKDADLIYVAAEYPDLKQTPEYQAAAKRAKERYQERLKSMPKQVVDTTPAEPVIKKWQHTLQQATDPQLVESILAAAQELGADDYRAGNYRVRILEEQIEVEYQDKLAMVINISTDEAQSQLIGLSNTINQYERGLVGAISCVLTDLERQREGDKEREQQRQLELQQELERQQQQLERQQELERIQQLERELYPNMDFSDPSPNVDFSDPVPDRDCDRDYDWSR